VLLAEDQAMIREALAALLSFEDDIEVVAQVGRGDEVTSAARDTCPDVALLDIETAWPPRRRSSAPARTSRSSSSPRSAAPGTCAARWSRVCPPSS
jgi:two-component system, NarL family, response regulator DesR